MLRIEPLSGASALVSGRAATGRAAAGCGVWGVAALLATIGDALASQFPVCTVRGELSGFARAASGHCYFSLKDADGADGALRCAMFRRAASLAGFAPADGMLVELRGRLGVFAARGELQLIVESMQRGGAGALLERFLQLKAKLAAEGLFDGARKRRPPTFPRCVGIVTSPDAAALHDVVTSLARRSPHVAVIVYPSPVQGADAPYRLAEAIALAGQRGEVDTLLLCRGGGSLEDLWAFNDERVVRAIAASALPVITGVGHETDVTLSDFAADLRAPTPTAAAELAAPRTSDCLDRLANCELLLQRRLRQLLDAQAQRLDSAALRLARPADRVHGQLRRLDSLAGRLVAARVRATEGTVRRMDRAEMQLQRVAGRAIEARRRRFDALAGRLAGVDPSRVLQRGYAWLVDGRGRAVDSVAGIVPNDALSAVLHDGRLQVRVEAVAIADASCDDERRGPAAAYNDSSRRLHSALPPPKGS